MLPSPGHAPDVSETADQATARGGRWSDAPWVSVAKNVTVLTGIVGGLILVGRDWGALPGQMTTLGDRVRAVEVNDRSQDAVLADLQRRGRFDTCRWQDSTISQCLHHLRQP